MPSWPLGSDTITLRVPTIVVDPTDNTNYYRYANGATVQNCSFQPFLMTEKFQEEFTIERESTRAFFRVFMPVTPETEAVTSTYRIVFDGDEYEVHSLIGKWRDFSGLKDHVAFLVKRRVG